MKILIPAYLFMVILCLSGCNAPPEKGSFGYDLAFLEQYQEPLTLKANGGKSMVLVSPELQGRVMTSTAGGNYGNSYGWMNYELFESGEFVKQINPFGGEDRFWMGPEGGQYSIFFAPGSDFSFENWSTPPAIDTEPFDVISQSEQEVAFQKSLKLVNYQDFEFNIDVFRTVSIFEKEEVENDLDILLSGDVEFVAFQSDNEILNTGNGSWALESGLLSIWILGMFNPSEHTTVILPYRGDLELNTAYFGAIPPGRLTITDHHVLYKGNGTHRFKLGLPPQNVMPYVGSYDAERQMLTIVSYSFGGDTTYVNSMWEWQEEPYSGDVINSYNDGPLENGDQLGPFYELESSSATGELAPGESIRHIHRTYHFEGKPDVLNRISQKILGIGLDELGA